VYLFFGRGAVFEVPENGRYTKFRYLDEVRFLCSGVIGGKFEEVVKMAKSKVVGASAKVTLDDGKAASAVWRRLVPNLFAKSKEERFVYAPYCAES